ncbi:hypothetical protein [Devosia lacusdianchii]|jgi:hypothetical protein|uniref:hypothetical protein n=1 Tax=Devosia lacusdianchii TaxID=2917991 RepID=UPI001F057347|nr:hypothetical protein [Devosia sp. JXJ CY 41]
MRLPLTLLLVIFPQMAFAQSCGVDLSAVQGRIAELELSYSTILSDISCDAPTIPAHVLMCDSAYEANGDLWRMGRLDDMAWVYSYENATGTELNHEDPPRDDSFIADRDACTDEACLCNLLIEHTNGSLGGTSPYYEQ